MTQSVRHAMRRPVKAGIAMLAGGVCVMGLSTALYAASSDVGESVVALAARGGLGTFTPASVDPALLAELQQTKSISGSSGNNSVFQFTPAGAKQRGKRDVTVAVRVDSDAVKVAAVRNTSGDAPGRGNGLDRINPVAFNLGLARGYQSFAQGSDKPAPTGGLATLPSEIRDIDAPDLSSFTPAKSSSGQSRFSPVIELDDGKTAGRAPRTFAGDDVSVDVGGAYRVAKNLRVTAGIRYSSERDRLSPATDGQSDSQAVYVGTRFRF